MGTTARLVWQELSCGRGLLAVAAEFCAASAATALWFAGAFLFWQQEPPPIGGQPAASNDGTTALTWADCGQARKSPVEGGAGASAPKPYEIAAMRLGGLPTGSLRHFRRVCSAERSALYGGFRA
ncbi:MAG TPA: hypothetical protein VH331_14355 [Allosphingosinicella sp.]|jgi:hypothetical protein|nr:hypothetical protein [Allosphingosinicella sp.]